MKLNQLQYFVAVCECHSVTHAAEQLYISQPSISSAIRALEDELGVKLFHRSYHSLIPTMEGEFFYHEAKGLLDHAAQIADNMEQRRRRSQNVQLGVPPMIGSLLYPELVPPFSDKHPDVSIEVSSAGSLTNAEAVREERLDMTLMLLGTYSAGFHQVAIRRSEIVLAVPKTHPLASQQCIEPHMLRMQKMASLPEDTVLFATLDKICKRHHMDTQVQYKSRDVSSIKDYVMRKNSSALLLRDVVQQDNDLVALPFRDPLPAEIGLVWKKRCYMNAGAEMFIRHVRKFPKEIAV